MDRAVLETLQRIDDPEIGVSIVDLGLVYQAEQNDGGVKVALTATSRSCPLGEFMREEARTRLRHAFPDAPCVDVELVWSPAWTPKRMNEAARRALGL